MLASSVSRHLRRAFLVFLLLAALGLGLVAVSPFLLAEYHLRKAQQALKVQAYARALPELEKALSYRPRRADVYLLAGRTARQAGEFDVAREHLRKCYELSGTPTEDQQLEELMLRAQTGELDKVEENLVPYLREERPQTPLVLEALARAYMSAYRPGPSWVCLSRWLELQPDNAEAFHWRGLWYSQNMNLDAASDDYRHALEIDPLRIKSRLVLAELFMEKGKAEEARGEYERVLAQDPSEPSARLGLARCDLQASRLSEAQELLAGLREEGHKLSEVCYLSGLIELQKEGGSPEQAERLLREALAHEPGHRQACYNLILCLRRLGKHEEADKQDAVLKRIEADQERLAKITSKEMNESPRDPALHYEVGEIYLRAGLTKQGVYWLNSALRVDPDYRPAHERLLRYYESLGPEGHELAEMHRKWLARNDKPASSDHP